MPDDLKFAERLTGAMKDRGLNQSELARKMETSQSTVSRWLCGSRPHRRTLDQIARTLNVRAEWLSAGTLPVEPPGLSDDPADYQDSNLPKEEKWRRELYSLSMGEMIKVVRVLSISPLDREGTLRSIFRRMEELDAAELQTKT